MFCIITIIGASSFVAYADPVIDDSKKNQLSYSAKRDIGES